jgi:hypothetical protein
MQLTKRDLADVLRSAGATLFTLGVLVLVVRRSINDDLSHLSIFLLLVAPAIGFYTLVLLDRPASGDSAPASTAVLAILAILLGTGSMFAFLNLVGAHTSDTLYEAGGFAFGALLAAYTASRLRVAYAALLAALAALVTWQVLWDQIVPHASAGTTRWLLLAGAVLLLAFAAWLARVGAIGSREVATAGAIAAVIAGLEGVVVSAFNGSVGLIDAGGGGHLGILNDQTSGLQSFGWDLYLLVVSVSLVWLGARVRARGLSYVGGAGLLAFIVSVGTQITRVADGKMASNSLAGWPLALLLLGLIGLAAPRVLRSE